jgi:hypothetical protein
MYQFEFPELRTELTKLTRYTELLLNQSDCIDSVQAQLNLIMNEHSNAES